MPFTPDETAADIFADREWLRGAIVAGVAYGVDLTLFLLCFFLLVTQIKQARADRRNAQLKYILLAYISIVFILVTLFMASSAKFNELAFIDNRDFPGGPSAYEQDMFSIPIDELGNVCFVISNWLADVIIVWRCAVIYKGCRLPLWLIMVLPCLLFLSSFATGLLWLLQISASSPFGSQGSINYTIPFMGLSLALNICVTIAIAARLLIYQHRITSALGPEHGTKYTSVAAMIVESAAIYSIYSLAFLIPFGINNPVSIIFLQSLIQVQIAATLLIVFRVAQGKGWTSDTATRVLTLHSEHHTSIPLTHSNGAAISGRTQAVSGSSGSVSIAVIQGEAVANLAKVRSSLGDYVVGTEPLELGSE